MDFQEFIYQGVPISVVILGLVQIIKGLGMPTKFAPLCSLIMGVSCGLFTFYLSGEKSFIWLGLISGLTASGVYSNISEGVKIARGR